MHLGQEDLPGGAKKFALIVHLDLRYYLLAKARSSHELRDRQCLKVRSVRIAPSRQRPGIGADLQERDDCPWPIQQGSPALCGWSVRRLRVCAQAARDADETLATATPSERQTPEA